MSRSILVFGAFFLLASSGPLAFGETNYGESTLGNSPGTTPGSIGPNPGPMSPGSNSDTPTSGMNQKDHSMGMQNAPYSPLPSSAQQGQDNRTRDQRTRNPNPPDQNNSQSPTNAR